MWPGYFFYSSRRAGAGLDPWTPSFRLTLLEVILNSKLFSHLIPVHILFQTFILSTSIPCKIWQLSRPIGNFSRLKREKFPIKMRICPIYMGVKEALYFNHAFSFIITFCGLWAFPPNKVGPGVFLSHVCFETEFKLKSDC